MRKLIYDRNDIIYSMPDPEDRLPSLPDPAPSCLCKMYETLNVSSQAMTLRRAQQEMTDLKSNACSAPKDSSAFHQSLTCVVKLYNVLPSVNGSPMHKA